MTRSFPCTHYEDNGDLTVACVNYRDYQGRGDWYVARLWGMCNKYLRVPHNFVCLRSEYTSNLFIGELPLPDIDIGDNPGYWMKVGLFKPGLLSGRVLYLDLDVTITGDITGLVDVLDQSLGLWALLTYSFQRSHKQATNKSR